jgi:hypothetical protein
MKLVNIFISLFITFQIQTALAADNPLETQFNQACDTIDRNAIVKGYIERLV